MHFKIYLLNIMKLHIMLLFCYMSNHKANQNVGQCKHNGSSKQQKQLYKYRRPENQTKQRSY